MLAAGFADRLQHSDRSDGPGWRVHLANDPSGEAAIDVGDNENFEVIGIMLGEAGT